MEKLDALRLVLITFGAYIMPFISRRLMLPSAVGEFFFGMIIGTIFLGAGETSGPVKILSEIGFMILMYIAGLELDLDRIAALKKNELLAYCGYALLLVGGALGVTMFLDMPVFFAIIIMCTAIGLLFSVLKDMGMVKTALGQTLILIGVIGEVITLVGITMISLFAKAGDAKEMALHLLGIALFIAIVLFVAKMLKLVLWWYPEVNRFFMSVGNPSEIGIRANLVNMFIFVALAVSVDIEAILGAFLGGVIFARLFADREEMLERLSGFGYGFLIPLFFIEVGTRFKFSDFTVPEVLKGALVISCAIFIVRVFATLALLWTKLPKIQLIYVPFSQSFALTLLVAAATTGEKSGLIDKNQASIVILTAVITAIIFPWLLKLINKAIPVKE